jgi:hypothetical protein
VFSEFVGAFVVTTVPFEADILSLFLLFPGCVSVVEIPLEIFDREVWSLCWSLEESGKTLFSPD